MRWPLRYQILMPFGGAMVVVVLSISLLQAFLAVRRAERRVEGQLQGIAQTLADASFPLTDAVLKQTRGLSGAEFLLVDRDGKLRSASAAISTQDVPAIPDVANFKLRSRIEILGQSYFHTVLPLASDANRPDGSVLHILYPQRELELARFEAAYPPLVLGALLLAAVAALSLVIAGRVSRPIVELRTQVARLVGGDFRHVPLPARNDELRDLVGSVNSLSDQLDEMQRAIKRAERLALLGQLGGGLAHELRNSVAGARLAVQLHERRCKVDRSSLEVALRQLILTETQIQRFLTAGQKHEPRLQSCELSEIAADVAMLVGAAVKHHNTKVEWPGADHNIELCADPDQLRQLLLNLVLNAAEAARPGGWVKVDWLATDDRVALRVSDSGPGPDRTVAERLFEPFVTGKSEGIGLGLTVARQIAEAHQGAIRLLSGGPTCFEVVLPVMKPSNNPRDELSTTAAAAEA